ncbi:hypothetical protein BaRGS_00004351 [Batillaria attramentaria]|uniref:Uncharacterized protein n=1 Tax=Batillaria attramentaria TaxID=370345 RepID=A0ABD0LXW3_9CAEN
MIPHSFTIRHGAELYFVKMLKTVYKAVMLVKDTAWKFKDRPQELDLSSNSFLPHGREISFVHQTMPTETAAYARCVWRKLCVKASCCAYPGLPAQGTWPEKD